METLLYLRTGREVRSRGEVLSRRPNGMVEVKPSNPKWKRILVTAQEIEAGAVRPEPKPRKKAEESEEPKKRERKPKVSPQTPLEGLMERSRVFVSQNTGDALMAAACGLIDELTAEIERSRNLFQ